MIPEGDRKRPSKDSGEWGWIHAFRQQGEYPAPTENCGKWMVFPHITEVDHVWFTIADAVEQGKLGSSAKVATSPSYVPTSSRKNRDDERNICIYTYDSEDTADLLRILSTLRELGIHHRAMYKEDRETLDGNYAGVNLITGQTTRRSTVKYYARPGEVELLVPKSRQS